MAEEQSFWESHRTLAGLARDAERFAVRLPLVGQIGIPKPEQLAFVAGLGALVALDLIEWPVAVAIGVGQILLAEQFQSGERKGAATTEKSTAGSAAPAPAH
jgi:hypothetical protein